MKTICFWRFFPYCQGRDGDQWFGASIKSNSLNEATWKNCSHWEQHTLQYLCRCKWKEAESGSIHTLNPLLLNLSTLHPTVTAEMVNHRLLRLFRMCFHALNSFSIAFWDIPSPLSAASSRHFVPTVVEHLPYHAVPEVQPPSVGLLSGNSNTLQRKNAAYSWKRKIIFKNTLGGARLLRRGTSNFAWMRKKSCGLHSIQHQKIMDLT